MPKFSKPTSAPRRLHLTIRWILAGLVAMASVSCKEKPTSRAATAEQPNSEPTAQAPAGAPEAAPRADEFAPGIAYTNYRVADVPWSVQVVRVDRSNPRLEMHSAHALGTVCGLSTLSEVVANVTPKTGEPLAGINGDFFLREQAYAGDPRGMQVVDGDLISSPNGGAVFWVDADGQPHAADVQSEMSVTWPDGSSTRVGLNEPRTPDGAVLYTPSLGHSTFTSDGIEFVLEKSGNGPWYPLPVGETMKGRVREIRGTGNTRLSPNTMVLSVGPVLAAQLKKFKAGAELTLSTATSPAIRGAETAIGGGPVLLREGGIVELDRPKSLMAVPYSIRSRFERHPRTAIGWNDTHYYLVQVDGRHRELSMGMTLSELSKFMHQQLRCTDAVNLDGGGSSTFWADGSTRNTPCEGSERELANALLVVRKPGQHRSASQPPPNRGG